MVTLFILFWIFYALPAILLKIPYIQQKVAQVTTEELSGRLGVPVRIDKVNIQWPNRLVLDGLYLEDQDGSVLFEANHVAAGLELLPLWKKKFVFTTIRLFGFSVNLKKETPQSSLNLQFVIDAFSSQDTTKKQLDVDLRFNSILIRRGNFSYHVLSEGETPEKFNPHHVDVKNLSANISLKAFNKDSLNAHIKKMSLEESSGFTLNKLSLNVVANKDSAYIRDFEIRLPHTNLNIGGVTMGTSRIDSLQNLLNDAPINLNIAPSRISLQDLSAFVPAFVNFKDTIELSAEASGFINDINLKHLTLNYSDKMLFVGQMSLKGITRPEEAYMFGQVNRMYITNEGLTGLVNNFNKEPIRLPDPVTRLGTIHFTGEISGFFDNLVAYGKVSSAIGSLQTDMIFGSNKEKNTAAYLSGTISSSQIELGELLQNDSLFGIARFDISIDAHRPVGGDFSGHINAQVKEFDLKGYRYENLQLAGNFDRHSFDGNIRIEDPNGYLYAEGMFRNQGENSLFNFTAHLDHFRPDHLNLWDAYESPDISLILQADFTGNTIDNVEGSITIDSLAFLTAPSNFLLDHLAVEATGNSEGRRLTIQSDIINGEVTGTYSFTTFVPSMLNTFNEYIPAFIQTRGKNEKTDTNNFSLLLTIENTESLSQTLKLPFTVVNQARITGHYNNIYDKFRLEAFLPAFRIGQGMFESGYVRADNPLGIANLQVRATNYNAKGLRNYLELKADASNNTVNTLFSWANNKERLFRADLSASTRFITQEEEQGKKELRTEVAIHKSPFVINDTIWYIEQAGISVQNGQIRINNFLVDHDQQFLLLDGAISKDPSDTLLVSLNQIELSYIFDILNIPVLQFAGKATGIIHANDLYGSRILNTDLEIENFSFNQVKFGKLNLFSEWDDIQQGILLLGNIHKNDSSWTDVSGHIYPVGANSGLDLSFDANEIDVAFLQPFLQNVAQDVQGYGSGQVRLFGPFSDLDIEGNAYVREGGLGIEFLNTYYTFSDSVLMKPGTIQARNFTVYDKHTHTAKIELTVNHNHFRDVDFDVNIQVNNMLVYDVTERINPMIYGTVFGSGSAQIQGNERLINFDINMRSEPKTSVSLNFMSGSRAAEYDFITFVDKNKLAAGNNSIPTDSIPTPLLATDESAELRMNFLLDITQDANIELIMDPVAGDKITGFGSGTMQIQYGTKSDLRMYGGFNILSGNYNFSLQQLIHRNFKIREGSTVTFQGDPYFAMLDVEAIYTLTANLNDLSTDLATQSPRVSVPVNCVLLLDGVLTNPTISFDIELPGSNPDLEQQVKSYVNTEDLLTRQIVYLLVLNKFTKPEFSTEATSTNELGALASSALSYQLSSILNSITDKVQIGTDIRTGQEGFTETEVEMLLSTQLLDNRLIFNGNFGYRNNVNTPGNVFVGEFDVEYMLTRSGEIRLKAYNHANDMYYNLTSSLTRQGLGILYKKDFNHISELFRRRRYPSLIPPADTRLVLPEDTVRELDELDEKLNEELLLIKENPE
ncbi:MAG: translocation/assembly module TamB domain-containing protein [Tannerellaceae bacterium]|nr:translocation/assembly module TamB domain-containing protein [Tannerellaceae bacterium]